MSHCLANAATPDNISTVTSRKDLDEKEYADIRINVDDLMDILVIAGVNPSEKSVDDAIRHLRYFLPGIQDGKICFQVYAVVIHNN